MKEVPFRRADGRAVHAAAGHAERAADHAERTADRTRHDVLAIRAYSAW
jgi:hypothetical protein